MADEVASKLEALRVQWNERAERYAATANRRVSLKAASELNAHLQLETASSVLEVSCGPGLGSIDLIRRLPSDAKVTVSDFSPVMVEMAKKNIGEATSEGGKPTVEIVEANALDLKEIATASVDRYVASLSLQLVPDADAMLKEARRVLTSDGVAGFVVWGRPENSGLFSILSAAHAELGLEGGVEHPNFALSKNLDELRGRFSRAGFSKLRLWPYLATVECWSGAAFAEFLSQSHPVNDESAQAKRNQVVARMGDEWLESKGFPIGLEMYIILARP